MKIRALKVLCNRQGQGLTEYSILMVLVVMGSVAVVQSIGKQLNIKLKKVRDDINKEITVNR